MSTNITSKTSVKKPVKAKPRSKVNKTKKIESTVNEKPTNKKPFRSYLSDEYLSKITEYQTDEIITQREQITAQLNQLTDDNVITSAIERGIFESTLNDHLDEYTNYKSDSFSKLYEIKFNKIISFIKDNANFINHIHDNLIDSYEIGFLTITQLYLFNLNYASIKLLTPEYDIIEYIILLTNIGKKLES